MEEASRLRSLVDQTLLVRRKMALLRWSSFKETADLVSSILNWVCPECGGRMGGHGYEFKCQGECQTDWAEAVLAAWSVTN
jgi:hypothetical protein